MNNFDHEIPCPDDRAMRKFLWFDYFHDANICRIEYAQPEAGAVTLTVYSWVDSDAIWQTLKGTQAEKQAQLERLRPRATCLLRFHGVRHFRHAMDGEIWHADEIINTRFKDSPLLHRLEKECGKPLYHLRIETAHGLIDVVFERFTIRKQEGRVDYRCDWTEERGGCFDAFQKPRPGTADKPVTDETDDFDADERLTARLYNLHHAPDIPGTLALAREIIRTYHNRLWEAEPYAAILLGLYGDASDLPALAQVYLTPELDALNRQHVLDAMARIAERGEPHA